MNSVNTEGNSESLSEVYHYRLRLHSYRLRSASFILSLRRIQYGFDSVTPESKPEGSELKAAIPGRPFILSPRRAKAATNWCHSSTHWFESLS